MNSDQISKLIVSFLIVALLTSSGLVSFALYINRGKSAPSAETAVQNTPASPFVENLPAGPTDPDVAALLAQNGTGATADFAKAVAKELVDRNPEGPVEKNGELMINSPIDLNGLIAEYIKTHPISPETIKASVSDDDIALLDTSDPAAVAKYLSGIADAISELQSAAAGLDPNNTEVALNLGLNMFGKTTKEFGRIKVPRDLARFHKAVLSSFEVSLNYTRLANSDPLGAVALSDVYNTELNRSVAEMLKETDRLQQVGIISTEESSLLKELFGVPTAYATLPTIDYTHIAVSIKDFVMKYSETIKEILLEFFKKVLLKQVTAQLMNWIAGGGKPQFITNWRSFLGQAVDQGIGEVLNEVTPQLCGYGGQSIGGIAGLGNVADFIRQIMQPTGYVDGSQYYYPRCTLSQAVQNINDFERDIRNGGWVGYTSLLEPQNTLFGSIIDTQDRVIARASQREEDSKSRAESGSGFSGQELCDNGEPPSELPVKQYDLNGKVTKELPVGSCGDGSIPHVATPGIFSKDLSAQGFNNAYNNIVSLRDYKALAAYAADMALSGFLKKGVQGLLGYLQKNSSGSSGKGGGYTAPPPESPSSDPATLANQILTRKQSSLTDAQSAAATLAETINILKQVAQACTSNPTVVADAKAQIQSLVPMEDQLSLQIQTLKSQILALERFIESPSGGLPASLGSLGQAQTEAEEMANKRAAVEGVYVQAGNLFSSCSADTISAPPPSITHLACVNNACAVVDGAGENTDGCATAGAACGTGP